MRKVFPLLLIFYFSLFSCSFQKEQKPVVSGAASISVEVHFSPRGGCTDTLIKEINSAKHSIDAAIYSFTSKKIVKAFIRAHKRGVKVRVIIDQGTAKSKRCVAPILKKAGVPVRFKRGSGGGLMHNKFAVIDGRTVITGSFNWTVSAEKRNDENLVVIKDDLPLAHRYEKVFDRLWHLAGLEE
ncbi:MULTISPECIES: phospholipase D family nuclease [unclassified Desulfurobacterium]|uniref:phospholipase D family nuclease n=1 Tax=Desulfurobacterium sp. TC5-1 TaxID=1158318 RepID=UPI0003B33518|nr:phospholipase D family protein [Desulfurobacterium sp. TC5-1]